MGGVVVAHCGVGAAGPAATAHALLQQVLGEVTGRREHLLHRRCGTCGGPHGKPELDDPSLHVSLASTHSRAAVAVTAAGPVGIDVEALLRLDFAGFAGVALGPDERDGDLAHRARCWTRKEAVLKATGEGLVRDPRTVDVQGETALGAHLVDVDVGHGLACAVALLAQDRPAVRVEERRL